MTRDTLLSLLPPTALAVALLCFPGWPGRPRPGSSGRRAYERPSGVVGRAASGERPAGHAKTGPPKSAEPELSASEIEAAFARVREGSDPRVHPVLDALEQIVVCDLDLIVALRGKVFLLEQIVDLLSSGGGKT